MFNSTAKIQKLNEEVLVNISSFLNLASILQLSLSCKNFRHLIQDEHVFKSLTERDFGPSKTESTSWLITYKTNVSSDTEPEPKGEYVTEQEHQQQEAQPAQQQEVQPAQQQEHDENIKLETTEIEQDAMETDAVTPDQPSSTTTEGCPHVTQLSDVLCEVKRVLYRSENKSLCDICLTDEAAYLNMSPDNHNEGKILRHI